MTAIFVWLVVAIGSSTTSSCAFVVQHRSMQRQNIVRPNLPSRLHGVGIVDLDTVSDIGYIVTIEKPVGVVFGENRAPFKGLSIDNVESESNGDKAGLKVGDQLMAVNNKSVIGYDFDRALSLIKDAPSPVELQLYRGTIKSLFTIVVNRRSDDYNPDAEEEDEFEEEGVVSDDDIVFDENYESPVIMSAEDFGDDTISISGVATDAAKSIGNIFSPQTIGGFFGKMFPQETIQLEDKDGK
jgi:PDZ domain